MLKVTGQKDKDLPYGRGIVTTSGIAYEVLFNRDYETIARRLGKQPGERVPCVKDFHEGKNYLHYDSSAPANYPYRLAICVNVLASFLAGEDIDKHFT